MGSNQVEQPSWLQPYGVGPTSWFRNQVGQPSWFRNRLGMNELDLLDQLWTTANLIRHIIQVVKSILATNQSHKSLLVGNPLSNASSKFVEFVEWHITHDWTHSVPLALNDALLVLFLAQGDRCRVGVPAVHGLRSDSVHSVDHSAAPYKAPICIRTYIRMYVYIYVYVFISTYVCMYACIYMSEGVRLQESAPRFQQQLLKLWFDRQKNKK